jgi:DNA-nicking Smr family endonuclease
MDFKLFYSYVKNKHITQIHQDKLAFRTKLKKPKIRPRNDSFLDLELKDIFEELDPNSNLFFARKSLKKSQIAKLCSGKFPIEAKLDLHGYTLEQAKIKLIDFLVKCKQSHMHSVLIIHGSGKHSANKKALLRNAVYAWLKQYSFTLAFASAKAADGGSGALYLLLKNSKEHKE